MCLFIFSSCPKRLQARLISMDHVQMGQRSLSRVIACKEPHTHKIIVSSKILEVLEKKTFQDRYLESPTDISCISKANEVAITTNGRHSACVDMGWVAKHRKHCVALYANFDLDQRAHVIPSQPKCRQGLGPNGLLPHTILRAM